MRLVTLCTGKTKERFVQDGIEKYLKLLRHYADVELREVREEKVYDLKDAPGIRSREAERILKAVPAGSFLVALDEHGQEYTSHEFAAFLNSLRETGVRDLTFVLGGAMGLDESIPASAKKTIALSRWTLTHEMARLVLLEQLYRAFTIITGKTYHY